MAENEKLIEDDNLDELTDINSEDQDGWRYTRSFSLDEEAVAMRFFERQGFVIFRDAASTQQCRDARSSMFAQLEESDTAFSRSDQNTWNAHAKLSAFGMPKSRNVVFCPAFLNIRQSETVHRCFSNVLRESDIVCSHDRWLFYRKTRAVGGCAEMPHWKTVRNIHLDMNPFEFERDDQGVYQRLSQLDYSSGTRDFVRENNDVACGMGRCVQGLLNMRDNFDDDEGCGGGTLLIPGWHRHFQSWVAGEEIDGLGRIDDSQRGVGAMQYKVADDSPLQREAIRATMREGSLLIWDQRVIHGSTPNTSNRNRFAMPIRMFPARLLHGRGQKRGNNRANAVWRRICEAGFQDQVTPTGLTVFGLKKHSAACQVVMHTHRAAMGGAAGSGQEDNKASEAGEERTDGERRVEGSARGIVSSIFNLDAAVAVSESTPADDEMETDDGCNV